MQDGNRNQVSPAKQVWKSDLKALYLNSSQTSTTLGPSKERTITSRTFQGQMKGRYRVNRRNLDPRTESGNLSSLKRHNSFMGALQSPDQDLRKDPRGMLTAQTGQSSAFHN